MAEGRMLKKRISKSRKFAKLRSDKSRLLYLMMLPHLDVEGRLEADPDILKSDVLPLLKWPEPIVQKCLEDLHHVRLINLYEVNGNQYLQYTKFSEHNKLRKDRESGSTIPPPQKTAGVSREDSGSTPGNGNNEPKTKIPGLGRENSGSTPAISKDKLSKDKLSKDNITPLISPQKQKFLEFVLLSEEEHKKLIESLGEIETKNYIECLNNYIGSKGRKYKSHYHTILNWKNKDNEQNKKNIRDGKKPNIR